MKNTAKRHFEHPRNISSTQYLKAEKERRLLEIIRKADEYRTLSGKLGECPFCETAENVEICYETDSHSENGYFCQCKKCGIKTKVFPGIRDAFEAWQKIAESDPEMLY